MIDVVMPTYNRLESLRTVIDSYICQSNLGFIIIVDDASTENIAQFAHELEQKHPGKIIYHRIQRKTTTPDVRNIGVGLSKNEYVFMGEDDVILPPDHFEVLINNMSKYGADIIAGRRIYLRTGQTFEEAVSIANRDHRPIFVRKPFEGYFERFVGTATEVLYLHANVLIKRSVFDKVVYDPKYIGNAFREETDFLLRANDAGFHLWLIPDTLSYHLKNTNLNKSGGARKNRFVYEFQVWVNNFRFFIKNKNIFYKKYNVKNIYLFALSTVIFRYTYFIKRRLDWKKSYEKK